MNLNTFNMSPSDVNNYKLLWRGIGVSEAFTVVKEVADEIVSETDMVKFNSVDLTDGEYTLGSVVELQLTYKIEILVSAGAVSWTVENEPDVSHYEIVVDGTLDSTVPSGGNYTAELPASFQIVELIVVYSNGERESFTPTSYSKVIDIKPGWNLLSLPVADNSISDLFSLSNGSIWIWRDGRYLTTKSLLPLQGFWIYANEDAQIEVSGMIPGGVVLLERGWNLVGPAKSCRKPDGLTVFGYGEFYQQLLDQGEGMSTGQGYWIFTEIEQEVNLGQ